MKNGISVKGFFRVQIVDKKTGKIKGESPWMENLITNYGRENCIAAPPFGISGSVQATSMVLASASQATSDLSAASSMYEAYTDQYSSFVTAAIITGAVTNTARITQSFSSNATMSLEAIGMVRATTGTNLICANSFTASTMSTDQTLNATYELRYATT